eukprot:CAMPEP_0114611256 /NCGR_PEP_ID=MMETSP0168-20121206/4018_1 /TAXON_ID=95228 ORGANISM="Vannella sp., Strain DIVA3 517/6/12" /NCGR_SAMPLE_ID=MMETSP0168 /ASSEMBLY_ACC=CAM_ASM_000044 /LENGTH=321 /DNA_ID=CAMNT_0001822215 /DNA_START=176 /DNA_END=1137 /DNA_ORIENTATION=-
MVESYKANLRDPASLDAQGPSGGPSPDSCADVDPGDPLKAADLLLGSAAAGENTLSALPAGLGGLRHSASMSSMSSLSSVEEERYDALLREHTAAAHAARLRTLPTTERSMLLGISGDENAGRNSRAGMAGEWLRSSKPAVFLLICVLVYFLALLIVTLISWESECTLFYPALALSCSGISWAGTTLAYLGSSPLLSRGTRFQARAKQEAALFVVFTCFSAFVVFVSLPLPYCLLFEDCVTGCSGGLRTLLEPATIFAWLLCAEILAVLLPWIWLAWAIFGAFRIIVTAITCKQDFCSGFYETNFRDWPSMGMPRFGDEEG